MLVWGFPRECAGKVSGHLGMGGQGQHTHHTVVCEASGRDCTLSTGSVLGRVSGPGKLMYKQPLIMPPSASGPSTLSWSPHGAWLLLCLVPARPCSTEATHCSNMCHC